MLSIKQSSTAPDMNDSFDKVVYYNMRPPMGQGNFVCGTE